MVKDQTDENATVVIGASKPEGERREEDRTRIISVPDDRGVADETGTPAETVTEGRTGTDVWGDLTELSTSAPSRPVAEGDTLNGRFVLERRIGGGGMGTVYKALDLRKQEAMDRNPYIAVKVLNEEFRTHPESLKSLQREAKKAQSLAHPNIVTVYDFDRDGTAIYMTMELQEGQPLNQIIRSPDFKGMPVQKALRIVSDVGAALAYAHENRIVHSDLKPGNVFLTDKGPAKVFDFGIARASKTDDADAETTVFDAGTLGALTPSYASPEMLEKRDPDPRDDIYALACIAYELLTGRHPFDRVPATLARDNRLRAKQPANLARGQWTAIQNALAFERERRTPNVKRFLNELSAAGPSRIRQAAYAVATMVVVVAAVATGTYTLWQPDTTEPPAIPPVAKTAPDATVAAPAPDAPVSPPAAVPPIAEPAPDAQVAAPAPVAPVSPPAAVPPIAEPAPDAQVAAPAPVAPVSPPAAVPPIAEPPAVSPGSQVATIQPLQLIGPLLIDVPCARIEARMSAGTVRLSGYARADSDLSRLRQAILSIPGVKNVDSRMNQIGKNLCAPIDFYSPYIETDRDVVRGLTIRTKNDSGEFVEGDKLVVNITTPDYDSYIYVDYFALDGSVVHLRPQGNRPQNLVPTGQSITLGDINSAKQWTIAPPFGTEFLVVLATPKLIFESVRNEVEGQDEYLRELGWKLDRMAVPANNEKIIADIFFITTKPNR